MITPNPDMNDAPGQDGRGRIVVYTGESLDFLSRIPSESVHLVATDPPFGINTKSDGMDKLSPLADAMNAARWFAEWYAEARRILRPDGALWTCCNWRTAAVVQLASWRIGWPIESMIVWDKANLGPGGQKGARPSYELVALFAKEDFAISNRSLPDQQTFPWQSVKPHGHPAEKPADLFRWIIEESFRGRPAQAVAGSVVLDPFLGSGTTGEAARASGVGTFVGSEIDPEWSRVAFQRVAATPLGVFDPAPPIRGAEVFADRRSPRGRAL